MNLKNGKIKVLLCGFEEFTGIEEVVLKLFFVESDGDYDASEYEIEKMNYQIFKGKGICMNLLHFFDAKDGNDFNVFGFGESKHGFEAIFGEICQHYQ